MSTRSVLILVLLTVPALLARPAESQEGSRMKALRVEVGYSRNHEGSDTGIGGAVRFVISKGMDDALRFETGLIAGMPYLGLDAGMEYRVPRHTPVGAVLRAGVGLLLEDGYIGPYIRGGGGLEWTLNSRIALRLTGQAGFHIDTSGPHVLQAGVDYRW